MRESQNQPFQLSFNKLLRVDFQGSRVTSDSGLILVRELDERFGLSDLIGQHLVDFRRGRNRQFPLADLLRQSVYSRLAGYEDLNDAARLSADPTFRLLGSEKVWERGVALTSKLHWFETDLLARKENLTGLATLNRELVAQAEGVGSPHRLVLDMDSSESPVYGEQEQSAYNGYLGSVCYHPLFLFNSQGDSLVAKLRPGKKAVYLELGNLFSLRPDLTFYDITSTYFEGAGPAELGRFGYSRDGRPRNRQIVIGMVMMDGWPIAHHVFAGNRLDQTTVIEVVRDLNERFALNRVVRRRPGHDDRRHGGGTAEIGTGLFAGPETAESQRHVGVPPAGGSAAGLAGMSGGDCCRREGGSAEDPRGRGGG